MDERKRSCNGALYKQIPIFDALIEALSIGLRKMTTPDIPKDISDKLDKITDTNRQAGKLATGASRMMGKIADVNDETIARFQVIEESCRVVLSIDSDANVIRTLLVDLSSFANRSATSVKDSGSREDDFQVEFEGFLLGETYANASKAAYRQRGEAFYNELGIHED